MHVNAKTVAFGGLMLALTEVCIALGSVIETNTLFLLAAASYLVGIVIREMGLRNGAAFYLAGVILGGLIAPNKFYVCSYGAMGLYILIREIGWERIGRLSEEHHRMRWLWIVKFIVFNVIYVGSFIVAWNLLFPFEASPLLVLGVWAAGQIGWLIYDKAYDYVQGNMWTKIRGRLM